MRTHNSLILLRRRIVLVSSFCTLLILLLLQQSQLHPLLLPVAAINTHSHSTTLEQTIAPVPPGPVNPPLEPAPVFPSGPAHYVAARAAEIQRRLRGLDFPFRFKGKSYGRTPLPVTPPLPATGTVGYFDLVDETTKYRAPATARDLTYRMDNPTLTFTQTAGNWPGIALQRKRDYMAGEIAIGTPSQFIDIVVDTGESKTWIIDSSIKRAKGIRKMKSGSSITYTGLGLKDDDIRMPNGMSGFVGTLSHDVFTIGRIVHPRVDFLLVMKDSLSLLPDTFEHSGVLGLGVAQRPGKQRGIWNLIEILKTGKDGSKKSKPTPRHLSYWQRLENVKKNVHGMIFNLYEGSPGGQELDCGCPDIIPKKYGMLQSGVSCDFTFTSPPLAPPGVPGVMSALTGYGSVKNKAGCKAKLPKMKKLLKKLKVRKAKAKGDKKGPTPKVTQCWCQLQLRKQMKQVLKLLPLVKKFSYEKKFVPPLWRRRRLLSVESVESEMAEEGADESSANDEFGYESDATELEGDSSMYESADHDDSSSAAALDEIILNGVNHTMSQSETIALLSSLLSSHSDHSSAILTDLQLTLADLPSLTPTELDAVLTYTISTLQEDLYQRTEHEMLTDMKGFVDVENMNMTELAKAYGIDPELVEKMDVYRSLEEYGFDDGEGKEEDIDVAQYDALRQEDPLTRYEREKVEYEKMLMRRREMDEKNQRSMMEAGGGVLIRDAPPPTAASNTSADAVVIPPPPTPVTIDTASDQRTIGKVVPAPSAEKLDDPRLLEVTSGDVGGLAGYVPSIMEVSSVASFFFHGDGGCYHPGHSSPHYYKGGITWMPVKHTPTSWTVGMKDILVDGKSIGLCKSGTCKAAFATGSTLIRGSMKTILPLMEAVPIDPNCVPNSNRIVTFVMENGMKVDLDGLEQTVRRSDGKERPPIDTPLYKYAPDPIDAHFGSTICASVFAMFTKIDYQDDYLFVMGTPFLQKFYTIFDATGEPSAHRIGFAQPRHEWYTVNGCAWDGGVIKVPDPAVVMEVENPLTKYDWCHAPVECGGAELPVSTDTSWAGTGAIGLGLAGSGSTQDPLTGMITPSPPNPMSKFFAQEPMKMSPMGAELNKVLASDPDQIKSIPPAIHVVPTAKSHATTRTATAKPTTNKQVTLAKALMGPSYPTQPPPSTPATHVQPTSPSHEPKKKLLSPFEKKIVIGQKKRTPTYTKPSRTTPLPPLVRILPPEPEPILTPPTPIGVNIKKEQEKIEKREERRVKKEKEQERRSKRREERERRSLEQQEHERRERMKRQEQEEHARLDAARAATSALHHLPQSIPHDIVLTPPPPPSREPEQPPPSSSLDVVVSVHDDEPDPHRAIMMKNARVMRQHQQQQRRTIPTSTFSGSPPASLEQRRAAGIDTSGNINLISTASSSSPSSPSSSPLSADLDFTHLPVDQLFGDPASVTKQNDRAVEESIDAAMRSIQEIGL